MYILCTYIYIRIWCICPINLWVIVCMIMDIDIKTQNDSIDFYRGGFYEYPNGYGRFFRIIKAWMARRHRVVESAGKRISSDPLHLLPSAAAVPVCSVSNRPRLSSDRAGLVSCIHELWILFGYGDPKLIQIIQFVCHSWFSMGKPTGYHIRQHGEHARFASNSKEQRSQQTSADKQHKEQTTWPSPPTTTAKTTATISNLQQQQQQQPRPCTNCCPKDKNMYSHHRQSCQRPAKVVPVCCRASPKEVNAVNSSAIIEKFINSVNLVK